MHPDPSVSLPGAASMPTLEPAPAFDADVRAHDAQLAALGLVIWVGSEPTFTDRFSQSAEWLSTAVGGDKESRAMLLLRALAQRWPGGMVLRSVGRRYPGEDEPRWNLGLYRRRDAVPVWRGPPDPLQVEAQGQVDVRLDAWSTAQVDALSSRGWCVAQLPPSGVDVRQLELRATPDSDLALTLTLRDPQGEDGARIELPQMSDVPGFLALIDAVGSAALACGLAALQIGGAGPPVDASVEWTTVTPDPAVIEVNTAPSVDASEFLQRSRAIYAAADAQRLAPYRLYFNGAVADSGGGGQITLGGPTPEASVFIRRTQVLPRLVRFCIAHPALSYLFAHDHVGSTGQSARADERGPTALDELALALRILESLPAPSPELLWRSIAPFLCDATGNSHRAEINVEKLWNPLLPGRGMLGLVEFRGLRMQHNPERGTALACLLRAIVAMLCTADDATPLVDWGRELHDRFALPFYLEQDLGQVLTQLDSRGLGLGPALRSVLERDGFRRWASVGLPAATLEVRRGLDFWPLLGDAGSPEQHGTSRLVDSSTTRLELRLRLHAGATIDAQAWKLHVAGAALPMRTERDGQGELRVFGLRFRSFMPAQGLHPALGVQVPIHVRLTHPMLDEEYRITLHMWRPDGQAYPGLPEDLDDAERRRAERVVVERWPRAPDDDERELPPRALSDYRLDLRFLA
jgi:uncharacterized protein (DUF2126 family)